METVVEVSFPVRVLEQIDSLVRGGHFLSRDLCINLAVHELLARYPSPFHLVNDRRWSKGGIELPRERWERTEPARERPPIRALLKWLAECKDASAGPPPALTPASSHVAHVLGLRNRFFPMKLAARWLLAFGTEHGRWPSYFDLRDGLERDAATLGSALAEIDMRAGRKRERRLAVGLPRSKGDDEQALRRFREQFVARQTGKGVHLGALGDFVLAVVDGENAIALTEEGDRFARLENPLIDHQLDSETTLSAAEREFLWRLITTRVPGEAADVALVLQVLTRGESASPDEIQREAAPQFPDDWSEVRLRTHLGGLLSRLVDLGRVKRTWEGTHSYYTRID